VSFLFERVGQVLFPLVAAKPDAMMEAAIEVGADDCRIESGNHEVICAQDNLSEVRDGLEARFGAAQSAKLIWRPVNTVSVADAQAEDLFRLMQILDESDDVQEVYANFEVSESALQKLGA
jgi:transcriptional/translational regulatory protein YebC/TACO1